MIRHLEDLVLLKEVDAVRGLAYSANTLRKKYPEKSVVIRHIAYAKKEILCDHALNQVTDLSEYVQLGELADHMGVRKKILLDKIYFMEESKRHGRGIALFDYLNVGGIYFIKLSNKLRHNFENYQPFLATYGDAQNMVCGEMLGDLKIGFY